LRRRGLVRGLLFAALAALAVLHNDLWLWDDPRLVAGLPAGLAYHVAFCLAAFVLMLLLVRFAWPEGLEVEDDPETRR
jgi:uncharacterized protein DUF3311